MTTVFDRYDPSSEDREAFQSLPQGACPRRYCWWWHSLAFDWHLTPVEGCTWLTATLPETWKNRGIPCKRAVPASQNDAFMQRHTYLAADGIAESDLP